MIRKQNRKDRKRKERKKGNVKKRNKNRKNSKKKGKPPKECPITIVVPVVAKKKAKSLKIKDGSKVATAPTLTKLTGKEK